MKTNFQALRNLNFYKITEITASSNILVYYHIASSKSIWYANHLTGFYMITKKINLITGTSVYVKYLSKILSRNTAFKKSKCEDLTDARNQHINFIVWTCSIESITGLYRKGVLSHSHAPANAILKIHAWYIAYLKHCMAYKKLLKVY